MPDAPSASIIVNNYNYGRFVGEAIDSALCQTHGNVEVIVVDDGSTDNSRDVIRSFGTRVTSVFKGNGGQGSAFNAGFEVSSGDVVCFLDADDLLAPTAIEEAVRRFIRSGPVKVEWTLDVIDEEGKRTGEVIPQKPLPCEDIRELTTQKGPFYDWLITPPSSGNSYSRRMLRQVLPMNEPAYRHGADVYLTMLAPIYGQVVRLPLPQGSYRMHRSNNYCGRQLDAMRLRDYIRRFDNCCLELYTHLQRQGVDADTSHWHRHNYNYLWPTRVLQAADDLHSIIPEGSSYIFLNGGQWNPRDFVHDRRPIAFLERNNEYWGPPENDEAALGEFDRLKTTGAEFFVIWWTEFWSLDHFPRLHSRLRADFESILENDRVIAFDLRA